MYTTVNSLQLIPLMVVHSHIQTFIMTYVYNSHQTCPGPSTMNPQLLIFGIAEAYMSLTTVIPSEPESFFIAIPVNVVFTIMESLSDQGHNYSI